MGRPVPPPGGAATAPELGAGEAFTRPIYGIARRSNVAHLALARLPVSQDQIQATARIGQHLLGLCDLLLAARAADLHEREVDLTHELAERVGLVADVAAHLLPRRRLGGVALLQERAAGVGEHEQLAALALLGADQALVLELRERRIHRARARAPDASASLLDLLHDLVAVARLLREQQQRGRANVAAARLASTPIRAAAGSEAAARESEAAV